MRTVVVLEKAAEDIEAARYFYDRIEAGVGDYFAGCIVADIEQLTLLHGIHGMHFGFHRMLAKRFPFGIYYREEKERTEVFAILDLRSEPTWIRDELNMRNG